MKLITPFRFRERQLLVGGGGAGKTTACLSQIDACAEGEMYVADIDYSMAWNRALDTDFEACRSRVHVSEVEPEWQPFIDEIERIVASDANEPDNWLVVDSVSPSWDFVQSWYIQLAMGDNIGVHMAKLRAEADTHKEYAAALAEDMNWSAIKKEYARVYRAINRWHGHLVLTAEGKSIKGERDADVAALYGPVGFKPVGEGRLHHATSTTLFLKKDATGYKFTSVKDRNRVEVENKRVETLEEGGFADSYLREVAGWKIVRKSRAA